MDKFVHDQDSFPGNMSFLSKSWTNLSGTNQGHSNVEILSVKREKKAERLYLQCVNPGK